jgi:TonB family protein
MPKRIFFSVICFLVGMGLLAAGSDGKKMGIKPPKAIYHPDPEYTPSAREDRIEGIVVVNIKVDEQGIPRDLKVLKSLRSDLDQKALEAVSRWRFVPAKKDGRPVPVSIAVELTFKLY